MTFTIPDLNRSAAVAGMVTAFIVNMGGSALAINNMSANHDAAVGEALNGAMSQLLFNLGVVGGFSLLTLCCCYPCNKHLGQAHSNSEHGPRTSFAASCYPTLVATTLASFILNSSIRNDPDLRMLLNMVSPLLMYAATGIGIVSYAFAKNDCKPFDVSSSPTALGYNRV